MLSIAKELKKKNIAEYLIFMWQIEDLIRANNFDLDLIKKTLISPQNLSEEDEESELKWFEELIDMMLAEGIKEYGHLQLNQNVIINLTDLHHQLISCTKYPFYNTSYYKALPIIVELRAKNADQTSSEIEVCFNALYGVMLLRLQRKEVTTDTEKAIKVVAGFMATLADYYEKDRVGELKFED